MNKICEEEFGEAIHNNFELSTYLITGFLQGLKNKCKSFEINDKKIELSNDLNIIENIDEDSDSYKEVEAKYIKKYNIHENELNDDNYDRYIEIICIVANHYCECPFIISNITNLEECKKELNDYIIYFNNCTDWKYKLKRINKTK